MKRFSESKRGVARYQKRIFWSSLPDGGYYPFALKERKWEVMLLVGRWDELAEEYQNTWLVAQQAGERVYQTKILMKQGELLCRRQNFDDGEKKLKQALALVEATGDARLKERVEDQLAGAYLFTKRYDEASAIFDRLCAAAESRGDEPSLGWFMNHQATIALEQGRIKQALSYIRRRLRIAKKCGNPRDLAHGYLTLGGIFGTLGKYKISCRYSRRSAEISRRIGDIFMLYYAIYNMGLVSERLGLFQEALAHYQDDLALARQLGDGPGEEQIREDIARLKAKNRIN